MYKYLGEITDSQEVTYKAKVMRRCSAALLNLVIY